MPVSTTAPQIGRFQGGGPLGPDYHLDSNQPKSHPPTLAKIAPKPPPLKLARVYFTILGNYKLNHRLSNIYEFGSTEETYDPCYEPVEKHVQVEDTLYLVLTNAHREDSHEGFFWRMFHLITPLLILTYDVSSLASFEEMKEVYDLIPRPGDGRIRVDRERHPRCEEELFVRVERYPVVVIGCCLTADGVREVQRGLVEEWVREREKEGVSFAGECVLDERAIEGVEGVVRGAVEVYHGLWKRGRREEDLYPGDVIEMVPVKKPEVHEKRRKRDSCVVL